MGGNKPKISMKGGIRILDFFSALDKNAGEKE
jgi:hypothetical protein